MCIPSPSTGCVVGDLLDWEMASKQVTRDLGRERFISAGLRMGIRDDFPGDPWVRLRRDTFPKWREAIAPLANLQSGFGSLGMRYRGYLEMEEEAKRRRAACKIILERWAIDFWLVERTDGSALRPASWMVDEAQKCCEQWSRPRTDCATAVPTLGSRISFNSMPPPLSLDETRGFNIPMEEPHQTDDETWRVFKQRVRKALKRHFERMKRRKEAAPVLPKATPADANASKVDHYEWLFLYQCCGWRLAQIRALYPHMGTDPGIWMGIRSKADLVGLALRPRQPFKATVATYLEIGPPYTDDFLNDLEPD